MVKITFIIPYDEIQDEVYRSLQDVKEVGVVIETTQIIGTQEAFLKDCDSDIVIARGVTYLTLKKNMKTVSLIEISVTGYDVIRAIHECKKKYAPSKIAIIGSETMIYGAESLKEIMDVTLECYKVENEEDAVAALNRARDNKADAVVGGLMTYNIANSMGWQCVWIKTGKEAIRQAITEALNTVSVLRLERAKTELFEIILENAKEAIIAVDQNGYITAFNRTAYKTLKIPMDRRVNGRSIKAVIPDSKAFKVIETGQEELGVIDTINNMMVVANCVPINVGGYKAGAVITFQNVDKIQEIESKIRKELNTKGLVAKYSFANIIGNSKELNKTIQTALKYSQVDSNVLLIGETGTGKELFAQSIHNASNRKYQPFVAVNCAAVPENLLESELFGYAGGAFSGAIKGGKVGLFELAHKGTLFLDEVSEIPFSLQAKLLRVLQEREIRRIGDDKIIPIDVGIISATNIDLREIVTAGKFRRDLLYRLDVLNLRIPSLIERKGDIECIAKHFIEKYCNKFNKIIPDLSPGAVKILNQYNWPGNIRELRNVCERLIVQSENKLITEEDVNNILSIPPKYLKQEKELKGTESGANNHSIDEEMDTILKLMKIVKLNKAEAAKLLGVSRTTLWRRLREENVNE